MVTQSCCHHFVVTFVHILNISSFVALNSYVYTIASHGLQNMLLTVEKDRIALLS